MGKFGLDKNNDGYTKKTSGMNGVGGSCVQALSSEMTVQVKQNGKVISRTLLSKDTYNSRNKIVRKGTKKATAPVTPTPTPEPSTNTETNTTVNNEKTENNTTE